MIVLCSQHQEGNRRSCGIRFRRRRANYGGDLRPFGQSQQENQPFINHWSAPCSTGVCWALNSFLKTTNCPLKKLIQYYEVWTKKIHRNFHGRESFARNHNQYFVNVCLFVCLFADLPRSYSSDSFIREHQEGVNTRLCIPWRRCIVWEFVR